ncbi:MAG: CheR family methyltransferase [Bacteroidota bacterium]
MNTTSKHSKSDEPFVVGIGASAGGLRALEAFFDAMPESPNMAFVVVVHLSPDHQSNMAQLLQDHTTLPVVQLKKRTSIEINHVYVIPPGKMLTIEGNELVLTSSDSRDKKLTTIDLFFRSLGKAKGNYCGCVILSGSGSDGAIGLKLVKEYGGIVLAQVPDEAEYPAMPRNAIETNLVDLTLPIADMPGKLIDYQVNLKQIKLSGDISDLSDEEAEALYEIFTQVNLKTGHNFSKYKRKSVLRRIERRMRVNQVQTLPEYLDFLKANPKETKELFKDLLISVTHFFRDPEAFKEFEKKIIPKVFDGKDLDDQVRVWVPGCATGEEAYSIAFLLLDFVKNLDSPPKLQVFATDIDEEALQVARAGRYPSSIVADTPNKYINRYFDKQGDIYAVKPEVKEIILFAKHDLLKDPPFSKLDLISCRNLLIYLDRDLQSKVFKLFHYALNAGKWLFLGMSDSILEATDSFDSVSKRYKIYRQSPMADSFISRPPFPLFGKQLAEQTPNERKWKGGEQIDIDALHHKLLVGEFAPPSVIINNNYDVIHATQNIDQFLRYTGGKPSQNILEMIRPEIRQVLRRLLFKAKQEQDSSTVVKKTHLSLDDHSILLKIVIHKISKPNFPDGLLHVIFKKENEVNKKVPSQVEQADEQNDTDSDIITALENELQHTKAELNITVEEYETSNEELRASNEELQSMNEELQSTTEQLETSQEELQSVNEELKSVNSELENKIEKLHHANSNLKNLMEATDIATIFVDKEYSIQFFTSRCSNIFNVISSDKGRPITHLTHQLKYDDFITDIDQVLEKLEPIRKVVHDKQDNQYIMQVRPYRTVKDKIDGVVLTFVDVTQLKQAEAKLEERAKRQEILADLGIYALQEHDISELVRNACEKLQNILDFDYCVMFGIQKENNTFEITYSNIEGGNLISKPETLEEKWDVAIALNSSQPLIVPNYEQEKRFRLNPLIDDLNITSGVLINIGGTQENYGALGMYAEQPVSLSEEDINLIQIIAHILGTAIGREKAIEERIKINKQLEEEVSRSERFQQEILNNSLIERWKLGEYLHDNLAQVLASLNVLIDDLAQKLDPANRETVDTDLTDIKHHIDEQIGEIRELSHNIIPIDVEEEGASYAFALLMRQIQKMHHVKCSLHADDVLDEITNREISTNLYKITQEAMKNAAIHGKANHIRVNMNMDDQNLYLEILDDGSGISPEDQKGEGMGLRIMQHRVELLGGTFEVRSLPDDEFTTGIYGTFPLEALNLATRSNQE